MTRKDSIIQAATVFFSEKGFKATSITDLSKVTGVAEGTIFYHFKTKEGLFLAILERVKENIIDEFTGYLDGKKFNNGLEQIEAVISFYLYLASTMENQFLLLHRHYPYKLAEENPICREHLVSIYDCLTDIFENAIRQGQEDGSITVLPARKIALIIFSMVDGIARFKTYKLYDAGSLFNDLIESCRRILASEPSEVWGS